MLLVASAGGEESMLAELIAAADSSPAADAVLAKTAEYLGVGIGSLINLFNPERVILGGWAGLLLGGRLLPAIRESARRNSLRHLFAAASIELGQVGPEAVTYGAATLPMEDFLNGASRPPLRNPRGSNGLQWQHDPSLSHEPVKPPAELVAQAALTYEDPARLDLQPRQLPCDDRQFGPAGPGKQVQFPQIVFEQTHDVPSELALPCPEWPRTADLSSSLGRFLLSP